MNESHDDEPGVSIEQTSTAAVQLSVGDEPQTVIPNTEAIGIAMELLSAAGATGAFPAVFPKRDETVMRLRTHMGEGEIADRPFDLSLNADNSCIFVEIDEEDGSGRVRYAFDTADMVKAAAAAGRIPDIETVGSEKSPAPSEDEE